MSYLIFEQNHNISYKTLLIKWFN